MCPFVDVCLIIPVLFYMLKARFRKSEASSCSVMLYNDVVIDREAGEIIRLVASVHPSVSRSIQNGWAFKIMS